MWNSVYIICGLLALATMTAIIIAPYVAMAKKLRPLLLVALVISIWAGDKPTPPPPPVRISDIKITSFKCDHTGLAMSWQIGTNVTYGVDTFIIQRKTRQIPARTGWSANWEDFDTTMQTNYMNSVPFHAQDNRFRVIVRKEIEQ